MRKSKSHGCGAKTGLAGFGHSRDWCLPPVVACSLSRTALVSYAHNNYVADVDGTVTSNADLHFIIDDVGSVTVLPSKPGSKRARSWVRHGAAVHPGRWRLDASKEPDLLPNAGRSWCSKLRVFWCRVVPESQVRVWVGACVGGLDPVRRTW